MSSEYPRGQALAGCEGGDDSNLSSSSSSSSSSRDDDLHFVRAVVGHDLVLGLDPEAEGGAGGEGEGSPRGFSTLSSTKRNLSHIRKQASRASVSKRQQAVELMTGGGGTGGGTAAFSQVLSDEDDEEDFAEILL
jgi:hypothetical protein